MGDISLPWPMPRRPDDEQSTADSEGGAPVPHYEIQQVNDDGSAGPLEILPITRPPWAARTGRRGFLGAGIASSVAAALLVSACDDDTPPAPGGVPPPAPPPSYRPPSTTTSATPPPTTRPTTRPTTTRPTTTTPPRGGGGGGGGGTYCTCNKVCTCIPICQAHRLLDADPTVRCMSEIVVIAMGARELSYLRWAAEGADPLLRARIEELIDDLGQGRRLQTSELIGGGYGCYLDSDDPVEVVMAAQVLSLQALSLGTRLTGRRALQVAEALTLGRSLHRERVAAWSS